MASTEVQDMDGPEPQDSGRTDPQSGEHGSRGDDSDEAASRGDDSDEAVSRSADSDEAPSRSAVVAVASALIVIAIDQATKALALDRLELGQPIHVIGTLEWELVYNRGSAFGLGQSLGPVIGVFAVGVAVAMLIMASRATKTSHAVVYGVVAGGAIGNVLDRLFRSGTCPGAPCDGFLRGAVIDFIDLNWWPVFNVADMAIVCGVIAIAVGSIFADRA